MSKQTTTFEIDDEQLLRLLGCVSVVLEGIDNELQNLSESAEGYDEMSHERDVLIATFGVLSEQYTEQHPEVEE